ncbi:MAG: helix-turn-helix transcriptional regulator [Opitutae bacterium]|nr:helix-turn-helix transcriptional regulator [Opitutae bacterium]
MTQPQLAKASGVATSIVNDVENGIRTAGSKTLNKIALGLKLTEEDRFLFLLNGLRLSKRDFLIPDFKDYPPEILNFLPYALLRSGIKSSEVNEITLPGEKTKNLQVRLKSGKTFSLEIRLAAGKPSQP